MGPRASPRRLGVLPGVRPPGRSPNACAPGLARPLRADRAARRRRGLQGSPRGPPARPRPSGRRATPGRCARSGSARGSRSSATPPPAPPARVAATLRVDRKAPRRLGAQPAPRPLRTTLRLPQPAHVAKPPVRSGGSCPHPHPSFRLTGDTSSFPPKDNFFFFFLAEQMHIREGIWKVESIKLPFSAHLEPTPRTCRHTRTTEANSRPPRTQHNTSTIHRATTARVWGRTSTSCQKTEQVCGKVSGKAQETEASASEPRLRAGRGRQRETFANPNVKKYPQAIPALSYRCE